MVEGRRLVGVHQLMHEQLGGHVGAMRGLLKTTTLVNN